ncbi:MAG: FecR domain-containing protein [Ferruginibacter sp.]|nr:FecR domain-containing protein [Cytophagales bacterium]
MDEHEFERLIDRYQQGECTPEERQRLERWLDSLEKRSGRFEDWATTDQQRLGKEMLASLYERMKTAPASPFRRIRLVPLLKVAASLILLIGLGYWAGQSLPGWNQRSVAYQERTSTTGVTQCTLSDGTLVWLKGKSKLFFPTTFDGPQREVRLEGEALFEVAKDSAHPFLIRCGSLLTRVVGTSFNVKSSPDQQRIEVVVLTGKVKVSSLSGQEEILLLPRQKALYRAATRTVTKTVETRPESYLAGTQYDMRFEDTPVSEVIRRIERKFNVRIEVRGDERAERCLVSADLTDQSLATTLQLVVQALGGDYQQQGETVQLSIPGCS